MINHGKIITKTYHKLINLFLYIPDSSAHPPGLKNSVIYGLLETYWPQNTRRQDFLSTTRFLFQNLIARGCKPDKTITIFKLAAENIEEKLMMMMMMMRGGGMINRLFLERRIENNDYSSIYNITLGTIPWDNIIVKYCNIIEKHNIYCNNITYNNIYCNNQ